MSKRKKKGDGLSDSLINPNLNVDARTSKDPSSEDLFSDPEFLDKFYKECFYISNTMKEIYPRQRKNKK